jgi:hypothetical protein
METHNELKVGVNHQKSNMGDCGVIAKKVTDHIKMGL